MCVGGGGKLELVVVAAKKVQPIPSLQRCVDQKKMSFLESSTPSPLSYFSGEERGGGGGGGGEDSCFSCQLPRKRCSNKPTFSCGAVTDISMTLLSSFSTGNLYQPCSDQTDHHDSAGPAEWRVRAGSVGVVGAGVVVFYK